MTLAARNGLFTVPSMGDFSQYTSGYDTIDAAGERLATVFQVYKAGTISSVYLKTFATTTAKDVKISLQGVSASGFPDGVILGTSNNGYATATPSASTWVGPYNLTASVTVTQGQWIAVVCEWANNADPGNVRIALTYGVILVTYNFYIVTDYGTALTSGTLTAGTTYRVYTYNTDDDFSNIADIGASANANEAVFVATGTTPTHWEHASVLRPLAKSTSGYHVCVALQYSDDKYYPPNIGAVYIADELIDTSPLEEIGNYVTFPFPFRAVGMWVYGDIDYDITLSLLNGTTDETLANCVIDADKRSAATAGSIVSFFDSDPAATVNIAKDTYYRLIVTPSSTSAVSIRVATGPEDAAIGGLDLGTSCVYTKATERDAVDDWAQTATKRVLIGLIGDQLDDGAGTGGAVAPIGHRIIGPWRT